MGGATEYEATTPGVFSLATVNEYRRHLMLAVFFGLKGRRCSRSGGFLPYFSFHYGLATAMTEANAVLARGPCPSAPSGVNWFAFDDPGNSGSASPVFALITGQQAPWEP